MRAVALMLVVSLGLVACNRPPLPKTGESERPSTTVPAQTEQAPKSGAQER